jgi:hypothetical protein
MIIGYISNGLPWITMNSKSVKDKNVFIFFDKFTYLLIKVYIFLM